MCSAQQALEHAAGEIALLESTMPDLRKSNDLAPRYPDRADRTARKPIEEEPHRIGTAPIEGRNCNRSRTIINSGSIEGRPMLL